MSHNAELSRRMAQARISVAHVGAGSIRRGDAFARTESEALRRIRWADNPHPSRWPEFRLYLVSAVLAVAMFAGVLWQATFLADTILWVTR